MSFNFSRQATILGLMLLLSSTTNALALCSPQDYIAYGRANLSNSQIQKLCPQASNTAITPKVKNKSDKISTLPKQQKTGLSTGQKTLLAKPETFPVWLSGLWNVTFKMKAYKVYDNNTQNKKDFNPFTKGMSSFTNSFTDIADKPEETRLEGWEMDVKNNVWYLKRSYRPGYNPGSAAFSSYARAKDARHLVLKSAIIKGHLIVDIVSPPYGNEGIENWHFNIDLAQNNRSDYIQGYYYISRKKPEDGRLYTHQGTVDLRRWRSRPAARR